jgi:glyoxylase-like metal-dependent hydrolase (beta-lactamase superfamily II)
MSQPIPSITVLTLNIPTPSGNSPIHPVLLRDEDGHTLVDTGMIGQFDELQSTLEELDVSLSDIKRVIVTHQDIDHFGNLGAHAGTPCHADRSCTCSSRSIADAAA